VRALNLEDRKHRRTVLFGIGLQLRRIYDIAEREPVPDHIARLLDKLDDESAMAKSGSAAPRNRSQ
jgi:Anti-sigma factor NepR